MRGLDIWRNTMLIPLLQTWTFTISKNECFSSSSVTLIFDECCRFRTWSFTLLKNDLDPIDNSDSVSSFPMMSCWGLVSLWGCTTGCTVLSWGSSSSTMDCAVPSCWVFSWKKLDWDSCLPKKLRWVAPFYHPSICQVFHSWEDQAGLSSHVEYRAEEKLSINCSW